MKRRSFISLLFATLIPAVILTDDPAEAATTINISANMDDEYAPYVVDGYIRNEKTGVFTNTRDVVKSGSFSKTLTYKANQDMTLIFSVTASRAGSKTGFLQMNDVIAPIRGEQRVTISLHSAT